MEKRVFTFEEACAYCGFEESYMYKLTSNRLIPHSKPLGKKIFFDRVQLENWLLSNPVTTNKELENQAATHVSINKK